MIKTIYWYDYKTKKVKTKKVKNGFEKRFFQLMKNAVFGKTMENVRKHRNIKLVKAEAKRNYLVSEANHHTTIFFWKFINHKNKEIQIFMNKPVYLGLSILQISKIVMYKVWYDYVEWKYGAKAKLCYMDIDGFI